MDSNVQLRYLNFMSQMRSNDIITSALRVLTVQLYCCHVDEHCFPADEDACVLSVCAVGK